MENPASLGAVVRDRRLALGYSLGQLATKVSKTAASIRAWEKGSSVPTEAEANALAAALDLDADLLKGLLEEAEVWEPEPVADVAVIDPWTGGKGRKAASTTSNDAVVVADDPAAEIEAVEVERGAELVAEVEPARDSEDQPEADSAADNEPAESAAAVVPADLAPADEADAGSEDESMDHGGAGDEEPQSSAKSVDEVDVDEVGGPIDDVIEGQEALETAKASLADEGIVRPPPPDPAIHEAMTEAVPVVPAAVAVATHEAPLDADLAAATSDPFGGTRNSNPLIYWWDSAVGWYRRVFDPNRKWIYRLRLALLLIAFYIMLRVLAWAGSELWDAIGEVLDSISFSPSETPDVTN